MTYEDLLAEYKTCTGAANALGLRKQTVNRWKDAGIPFEQQFRIQMKTKGKLKAQMPALGPKAA